MPLFNATQQSYTRRDSLGLQSLSSSIQARVCPIINVVTPHPFYWAFLVWNYHHFYSLPENKDKSDSEFNNTFVKRNDFYFALSHYLAGKDTTGIVGRTKIEDKFGGETQNDSFSFYKDYYQSHFGGMQYYNNGCFAMGFVPNNRKLIDLTKDTIGTQLTKAFDALIAETKYFKEYILQKKSLDEVSREAIVEISDHLNMYLNNMDEVKEIIYKALFSNPHLSFTEEYIKQLLDKGLISKGGEFSSKAARKLLYGDMQPKILDGLDKSKKPKTIITQWELIVANQYYVSCMEKLWKFMLSILGIQCTQEQWIDKALSCSSDLNLKAPLSSFSEIHLSVDEMEEKIYQNAGPKTLSLVISVLMSIINRFKDDVLKFNCIPSFASENRNNFTVFSLIKMIKEDTFENVEQLLRYLLKHHIIERHQRIATIKKYQGRDGFLYEFVDGLYSPIADGRVNRNIDVDLPALRFVNVFYVLKDLGKL